MQSSMKDKIQESDDKGTGELIEQNMQILCRNCPRFQPESPACLPNYSPQAEEFHIHADGGSKGEAQVIIGYYHSSREYPVEGTAAKSGNVVNFDRLN
jgi:hypothetical protein